MNLWPDAPKPRHLTALDWATIRVLLTAQLMKLGAVTPEAPKVIFMRDPGDEHQPRARGVAWPC